MGRSPEQDFIYGFYTDKIPIDDDGDALDINKFCKKHGLAYACSYEGVAIGFEPDWLKITGNTRLGDYNVSTFNVNAFATWLGDAYAAMTDQRVTVVKEFLQSDPNESPELWTISSYG